MHARGLYHPPPPLTQHPSTHPSAVCRYGCPINASRDTTIYKRDPQFWNRRPLSAQMIAWATEDISCLLQLQAKQGSASEAQRRACADRLTVCRDALLCTVPLHSTQIGRFIGKGGANIRALQEVTGAFLQPSGDGIAIYARDDTAMQTAKNACKKYAVEWAQPVRRPFLVGSMMDYRSKSNASDP